MFALRPSATALLATVLFCSTCTREQGAKRPAPPAPPVKTSKLRLAQHDVQSRKPLPRPKDSFAGGVELIDLPWHRKLALLTDRRRFGRAFARRHYAPPENTLLIAARIFKGVGQPVFEYYSLGSSGFRYSPGEWVPASTVKLATTIGALYNLKQHGLSGAARVRFRDPDGVYDGPVDELYRLALLRSSNLGYNRLMMIAGFDFLNNELLSPRFGLPTMTLQSRYGSLLRGTSLRLSPEIAYEEGAKKGVFPEHRGKAKFARCKRVHNCVTFFELQEVLRRIMLHNELPAAVRFPLFESDVKKIQALLLQARDRFHKAPNKSLGHDVLIYNSVGRIPGQDLLENGFIVDQETKERFLIAVLVPFKERHDPKLLIEKKLAKVAQYALDEIAQLGPLSGTPLQLDAGLSPVVQIASGRRLTINVIAEGADGLRVWLDRRRLLATRKVGRAFTIETSGPKPGEHLLVLQALNKGKVVGYRCVGLRYRATTSARKASSRRAHRRER